MKPLIIKDNSNTEKERFSEVADLTHKIADKTLGQLEKEGVFVFPEIINDADDITKDQTILKSVNNSFHTGNVMGFLGLGNERIIIESRFSRNKKDYFFQYLLEKVLDFPNILDLKTDSFLNDKFFNMLIFLFPYYLKSAMRKGIFKTYVRKNYNDSNVRGIIDISRHISKNTPFTGSVAYSQREYSYDNYLTQLIRHTIEFIRKKPYGNNLLIKVKDEVNLIIEATSGYELYDRQRIIAENKSNRIRHAYYREYKALQNLCLLILQNRKQQIGCGTRQVYGILFDGAWLWEEYINTLICDIFYHPMNKGGKGAQWLFSDGKDKGLIYPDFISQNAERRIIADAKYKPSDNIGNKDYLQLLAYMFRFDAQNGFYFYPNTDDEHNSELYLNKGSTYENVVPRKDICVIKYGLKIPDNADTYDEFIVDIKKSEEEFISKLHKYTE